MANILYMNLLTGEYTVSRKINDWFSGFLSSFNETEYYAQHTRLKPWQYKGLMELAERNHFKMLSAKQWDIFVKYIKFEHGTYEEFANFIHDNKKFQIRINDTTGFVAIKINTVN